MNNEYGTPIESSDNLQLGELFIVLIRHKWMIAAITALTSAGLLFWIGTRTPEYQARATLLLEEDEAAGGVLSELASLTSDPKAEAEIALIQSRSLAEVTASARTADQAIPAVFDPTEADFDPFGGPSGSAADPSAMDQLGLNCLVERHDLRPLASLWSRVRGKAIPEHRLRARMVGYEDAIERPEALDVFFYSEHASDEIRIRISPHDGFIGADDDDALDFVYVPGSRREAFGWDLSLWATGDFLDQRYTVTALDEQSAIKRLMESTTAEESGRKTGVVFVSVSDSDPYRAAETANALAKNYIRRSVRIGQQKATRTVRFIEAQLAEQLSALSKAEAEVVRLQTLYPETIAVSVSATALIEQSAAVELQIAQAQLAKQSLEEALELLELGDLSSLARLGPEIPNLLALGYLEELSVLEAESLRLDRTDVPGFKALLQSESFRLQTLIEGTNLRIEAMRGAKDALSRGESSAVARLASEPGFSAHLSELSGLDAELSKLRATAKPENPILRNLEASRSQLLTSLTQQLDGTLAGTQAAADSYAALASTYAESLENWPIEERLTIEAARSSLAKRVIENLQAQVEGVASTLASLSEQADGLGTRLSSLPNSELELAEPMRQRMVRTTIVEFLLSSQQEAGITAAATSAAAVLIDPATPPPSRIFPRTSLVMLFGTLAGLLFACMCALIHNRVRSALHTEAEVERTTDLPVLGSVPSFTTGRARVPDAKRNSRFIPLFDNPEGPQSEAYRQIRASLRLALPPGVELGCFASTSCIPGEGKTVTNVDLALAFAETGKRVLLVDGDLRKPRIHDVFQIERGPGFAESLEGTADWRKHVHERLMGAIDVLPAGYCKGRPGEVLASPAVPGLVEAFREEYDMVVFDLPPAVVVADVANFAKQLDALVLLYRCGGVPGKLLETAANRLRRSGAFLAGVILNAVVSRAGSGDYGYGYGYGYSEDSPKPGRRGLRKAS